MSDAAHVWTDKQIEKLQSDFRKTYRQAATEMRVKLGKHMQEFDKANAKWKQRLKDDPSLHKEYKAWLTGKAAEKKWIRSMSTALVEDAVRADQIAAERIYDTIPYIVAENANRAAYAIQEGIGRKIDGFALYDADTVRRLITESPDLLPPIPKSKLNLAKARAWDQKRITASITQSILQGESIPDAAKRLTGTVGMMKESSVRAARTAITGAENAGRIQSYRRAEDLGIKLEQQWLATLDDRTRFEHRLLDGEHVPVGEKFHVPGYGSEYDVEFPGDPGGLPEMVYNCRCTLVAWLDTSEPIDENRWSRLPEDMTYDEWKSSQSQQKDEDADASSGTAEKEDRQNVFGKHFGSTRGQIEVGNGKVPENEIESFNRSALQSIKDETGYSDVEAVGFQRCLTEWLGGDYEAFTRGEMGDYVKVIDDGLSRMGAFDGRMFRGMHFLKDSTGDMEAFAQFSSINIGDTLQMKSISSWTSTAPIAERYASIGNSGVESVLLVCNSNKTAAGVRHLSKWRTLEDEVLAPSTARWQVTGVFKKSMYDTNLEKLENGNLSPLAQRLKRRELEEKAQELKAQYYTIIEVTEIE